MEAVALIVALASFAVSWAALYATTLKRAHIAFQYTPLPGEWHIGGWQALVPSGRSHITLAFYVHNSGANAGILEAASATSTSLLDGVLREPVSWYPVSTAPDIDLSNTRARFPRGVDAGDIEEFYFVGRLPLSLGPMDRGSYGDAQADIEREEQFARQLHRAQALPMTVSWRYTRPAGALSQAEGPQTMTEFVHVEIPAQGLRDHVVSTWESQGAHAELRERARRLIAIATTGEPPAQ